MSILLIFRFLMLKWYCWRRRLRFGFFTVPEKKDLWLIACIKNSDSYKPGEYLMLYVSKKPSKKSHEIYNRLRCLIYRKMVTKRFPIKKHYVNSGKYNLKTWC